MKLAQTNLSDLAGRVTSASARLRQDQCAPSSAPARAHAGARASARFTVRQRESSEISNALIPPTLKRRERRAPVRAANESQRDSGSKPKVARHELPWVNVAHTVPNPNGVASVRRARSPQPRWGWQNLPRLTQGSPCGATLGWRTQSRWDCPENFEKFIPPASADRDLIS